MHFKNSEIDHGDYQFNNILAYEESPSRHDSTEGTDDEDDVFKSPRKHSPVKKNR